MKHSTRMKLPFNGAWFTFWGGDTKELNQHHGVGVQNYAFDFLILDEKRESHKGSGSGLSDYYSFGKDIVAPASGTVIEAVDGIRDNPIGTINDHMLIGNYVLLKHAEGEFSIFAHLKQGSIRVKSGDQLKTGEVLGLCGNSGHTTEPHLHYHLQTSDTFSRYDASYEMHRVAEGLKVYFSDIEVEVDQEKEIKSLHSPVKGEVVRNIDK